MSKPTMTPTITHTPPITNPNSRDPPYGSFESLSFQQLRQLYQNSATKKKGTVCYVTSIVIMLSCYHVMFHVVLS